MSAPLEMLLVLGLPGAGKSGYALNQCACNRQGSELISFDELRRAFGHVYHVATEQHVNAVACTMARLAFMRGRSVVIDESITVPGLAMDVVGVAREYGALVRIRHICAPVEACRGRRVPDHMAAPEFERKLTEWQTWGKFILSLGDEVRHIEPRHNATEEPRHDAD